jgi:hypothetical protein
LEHESPFGELAKEFIDESALSDTSFAHQREQLRCSVGSDGLEDIVQAGKLTPAPDHRRSESACRRSIGYVAER